MFRSNARRVVCFLPFWIGANPVQQNELVLKTDIREFSFETSQ